MTAATGLVATVDVAREASDHRIGPRVDGSDLQVGAGRPLRLALLGGRSDATLAGGRAAALAACADVVLAIRGDARSTLVERAAALRDARPTTVLLVADGQDGSALVDLAEALRLGCAPDRPAVLVAGHESARRPVLAALAGLPVEAMPDAATSAGRDAIVARLRAMRRDGGSLVLRDESVDAAARAVASATGRAVVIADVSGTTSSLAYASASGALTAVHAHLGVGASADRVVAGGGLDRVRRWMPRAVDTPALLERVFNRARWPDAVAATPQTLALEMALARECLRRLLADAERAEVAFGAARSAPLIVCTGQLARFPRAAQTVLVAVDALAPETVQVIARERPDALIAAGAIASRTPADVMGALAPLALVTSLAPRRVMTVRVSDASGAVEQRVVRGAFLLVPTRGAVELTVQGIASATTAEALELGVVIDARGRPLELPPRDAERLPAVGRWAAAVDALPPEAER